ncbi:MAG: calcium/proton exchanger [Bryobacteraceae bacterium]|nr:calcium/proton exchanger [Bryobacteraceae bacterium]
MRRFLKPSFNWLLILVPASLACEFLAPGNHVLLFALAALAIVPLAGWMGRATEHLAHHTSEGVGGLLNATFGNAAELIIALMALRGGLHDVVKASLTGSIIGNVLLVMGAAFAAGGLRHKTQTFHEGGARIQSTMMTLATIALILPAAFHHLGGAEVQARESGLSLEIAVVMLVTYGLGLVFTLHTHRHFFSGHMREGSAEVHGTGQPWPLGRSLATLGVSTAFIAWMSEILVGSVEPAGKELGLSSLFVGVVVVAVIGNAAEHSTAILMAMKDRMDLSLGIAMGSSIQVALFVAPALVLASYGIADRPMDLVFTPIEILAVFAAVIIGNEIARDGESNWLEGVQLLAVYLLLAIVFYFMPESAAHVSPLAG